MPHMLTMATAKIGHPMTFFIKVIPNYALLHDSPLTFFDFAADRRRSDTLLPHPRGRTSRHDSCV